MISYKHYVVDLLEWGLRRYCYITSRSASSASDLSPTSPIYLHVLFLLGTLLIDFFSLRPQGNPSRFLTGVAEICIVPPHRSKLESLLVSVSCLIGSGHCSVFSIGLDELMSSATEV